MITLRMAPVSERLVAIIILILGIFFAKTASFYLQTLVCLGFEMRMMALVRCSNEERFAILRPSANPQSRTSSLGRLEKTATCGYLAVSLQKIWPM